MTKKKKLRQKHQPDPGEGGNTSEDENIPESSICPHITKSVNIKKAFKNKVLFGNCQACSKLNETASKENLHTEEDKLDNSVWLCMQCGHQGCGRFSAKHSLQHYNTPHSDSHALVINTTTWAVWCYKCDDDVDVSSSKFLSDSIEIIKKQGIMPSKLKTSSPSSSSCFGKSQNEVTAEDLELVNRDVSKPDESLQVGKRKTRTNGMIQSTAQIQVKGLVNLVNTCFFNAVMQNLSQIPCFLDSLENHCKTEITWRIIVPPELSSDYEEETIECPLPASGALTQALIALMREMNSVSQDKKGIINPMALFKQVSEKCPQFKGQQQQDSHELLRCLLDGVRTEEVKRQKRGILKMFNLTEKVNPDQVHADIKFKLKAFGKNVSHTIIERIFGGQLVSTVFCEECKMSSQVFEPFMDLSLPVSEEKKVRPGLQKRLSSEDTMDCFGRGHGNVSKHQEKKQKRQNKKDAKKQAKLAKNINLSSPLPTCKLEQNVEDEISEPDVNDADIEDNADDTTSLESVTAKTESESPLSERLAEFDGISKTDNHAEDSFLTKSTHIAKEDMNYVTELVSELVISVSQDSLVQDDQSLSNSEGITRENYLGSTDSGFCNSEKLEEPADTSKYSKSLKQEWLSKSWTSMAPRYIAGSHECSVLSCLNLFTLPELLTGKNKFGCENCSKLKAEKEGIETEQHPMVYTNATKQLLIFSPPAVLTLHLKRFQQNGMSLVKVNRFVEFPLILDLAPFCSSIALGLPHMKTGQDKILYSLCGVVEHSGKLSGGHYTASIRLKNPSSSTLSFLNEALIGQTEVDTLLEEFMKKRNLVIQNSACEVSESKEEDLVASPLEESGKWYYISDTHVSEVNETAVLKCQAYLLFYERIF